MTFFLVLVGAVAVLAGAIASVSGFGIGSLLTPLLAVRVGTKLAVAAVSVPHLAATGFRFWLLRKHVDCRLLLGFGLMSAAGGLAGALLHAYADSPALWDRAIIFNWDCGPDVPACGQDGTNPYDEERQVRHGNQRPDQGDAMTMHLDGIEFGTAGEAIQHTYASGWGVAI